MRREGLELAVERFRRLAARRSEGLVDDRLHGAVVVRPRRVDPHEEGLERSARARGGVDEPAEHAEHGPEVRVRTRPRADEHQAADHIRMSQGQLLTDLRPPEKPATWTGPSTPTAAEDRRGVLRHRGGVERLGLWRQWRSARAGVVEGDER